MQQEIRNRKKAWSRFIYGLALLLCVTSGPAMGQQRSIRVDYRREKGALDTFFKKCIGAGRANEGLRADWQQQLAFVKKECGFEYIRMHGLLHDDMGIVYREDKNGNPSYNWQYIDLLYDHLLQAGIKPFVELSFMPAALASGPQTVFWWKGNITPPKDEHKWADLIRSLVQHFTERYGTSEVITWYFEVWNEPNLKDLFFTGGMQDYFRLYAATAKAVKAVDGRCRVGGPATAANAWIPEFIRYCREQNVPLDFIATHTYGVKEGFLDTGEGKGQIIDHRYDAIYRDVLAVQQQIKAAGLPGTELHYTEWSSSYSPRDPVHDSYHQAAYILDKIKHSAHAASSMSYWTFTDIFEENGPGQLPFHGGFGLLNYWGIPKPAFFSYQYLNRLGRRELENSDPASFACKDKNGNLQLLCWDFTITHPGDSVTNQVYYRHVLPAKRKGQLDIDLKQLPPGKWLLQVYRTGFKANDAYTAYLEMGAPVHLSLRQEEALKSSVRSQPVISEQIEIHADGGFRKQLDLQENDVFFIEFIQQS